jgi:adenylate cyclase
MSESMLRDALRLIQDIVIEAKGSPLDREAVRRLEEVLRRMVATGGFYSLDSGYSQREATILFADLRGFSAIAAAYPPDVVLGVLSRCFGRMTEIVVRHYGTIDKFMGDAIMVVFHGDPSPRDHAQRAVLCAVEMQIGMKELRHQHHDEKLPEIYIGIGISTGNVMSGLIGSDAYRAYTVIGEDVNLAARIEAFSLRGQVLMSEATYAHCRDFVQAGEPMDVYVKGKSDRLRIRELRAIPELGKTVPRQDLRRSPRVAVALDLEYWPVARKVVDPKPVRTTIRDISYSGALAYIREPLPLYSELKLKFNLPRLAVTVDDIYARIVSLRAKDDLYLAGLEFTSLSSETSGRIQLFVQMCIQDELQAPGLDSPGSAAFTKK